MSESNNAEIPPRLTSRSGGIGEEKPADAEVKEIAIKVWTTNQLIVLSVQVVQYFLEIIIWLYVTTV